MPRSESESPWNEQDRTRFSPKHQGPALRKHSKPLGLASPQPPQTSKLQEPRHWRSKTPWQWISNPAKRRLNRGLKANPSRNCSYPNHRKQSQGGHSEAHIQKLYKSSKDYKRHVSERLHLELRAVKALSAARSASSHSSSGDVFNLRLSLSWNSPEEAAPAPVSQT